MIRGSADYQRWAKWNYNRETREWNALIDRLKRREAGLARTFSRQKEYDMSPARVEKRKLYQRSEKFKAYRRAYGRMPEQKFKAKLRYRLLREKRLMDKMNENGQ